MASLRMRAAEGFRTRDPRQYPMLSFTPLARLMTQANVGPLPHVPDTRLLAAVVGDATVASTDVFEGGLLQGPEHTRVIMQLKVLDRVFSQELVLTQAQHRAMLAWSAEGTEAEQTQRARLRSLSVSRAYAPSGISGRPQRLPSVL